MVNFNGNIVSEETLFLNSKNRGFRYGDALSESLRAIDGKLVFWEDHYLKLMASMRILRMEIPMNFTMEYLEEQQLFRTLQENDLEKGPARVDIFVFRDAIGKMPPEKNDVAFCIEVDSLDSSEYRFKDDAYEVELFKDFFVSGDMLSTLGTNNKMLNTVGSIFAKENDYDDCLLLNHKKMVVGSLIGNFFLISKDMAKTAPLMDGCSNTIIRDKAIKILQESDDLKFLESSISPFELQKADELFITTIEEGIIPITKYRKKIYGNKSAKKLMGILNTLIAQEIGA